MIQRDYAQGRTDKKATDVRNNILNDIFSGKDVHFDLVFGSKEKRIIDNEEMNCFVPVDGQQRLTTIFLLYLYRQKMIKQVQKLELFKFSYDTRRAASDFCKSLTSEEWFDPKEKTISDVIKDSTWFMNYWEKDPTVEGMLNMLDAIHSKYKEKNSYPDLSKVTFYFFDLESNGLNENLYLKMNSRGKPLTAFENLRAKIEKVLPDNIKIEEKWFPKNNAAPKDDFKEKWKYFMDRDWTEIFWDSNTPNKYDISIAKFIVRFLAGYWAAYGPVGNLAITYKLKDLNRKEHNDKNYADFIPFDTIREVLEIKNAFPTLAYALTTVPTISPYWKDDKIEVSDISEYKFLAVAFTYVMFDSDESSMRFAWNMTENYVTDYDTFVMYCKRVAEIQKNMYRNEFSFYKALSSTEFVGNTSDQMEEEIAKAKQIIDGKPRSDGKTWKDIITEAEQYAFFKGAIRFLFTQNEIGDDWKHFDNKYENAKKYFSEIGVKDGETKYKSNALLMKSLLANCDDFWHKIWWHFEFSNDSNRWKRILLSNNWRKAVDAIMCKEVTFDTTKQSIESITEPIIKNIVDDGLMDYVCNKMPGAWIRSTYHDYHAIWQSGYPSNQIVLNPILAQLETERTIYYSDNNKLENSRYYKCEKKNVDFKYRYSDIDYFFLWWGNPNEKELDVYLMEKDWKDFKKRSQSSSNKVTEEDKYFCFRVENEMTKDNFVNKLECLIKQEEQDKGQNDQQ